jgi:hypothetical protein
MSALARLKVLKNSETGAPLTDKTIKSSPAPGFVGFVGSPPAHFEKICDGSTRREITRLMRLLADTEPDRWPEDVFHEDLETACGDADSALVCLWDLLRQQGIKA